MENELKERVLFWSKNKPSVTVPMVQKYFELDYSTAREVIRLLTEEKLLEYTGGLAYVKPKPTDEEIDRKTNFKKQTAERLAKLADRRREFSFRSKIDEDVPLFETEQRKRFFDRLTTGFMPVEVSGDYFVNTDISYPNEKKIMIKAEVGEENRFTDCGRTMAYLKEHFDLDNPEIVRQIDEITSGYNIRKENDELVIAVSDISDASEMFLFLYAAIERLINIPTGELLRAVEAEVRKKSLETLKAIVLEKETLEEAKTEADRLLTEARNLDDKEAITVRERVLRALTDVTEENYARTKRKLSTGV